MQGRLAETLQATITSEAEMSAKGVKTGPDDPETGLPKYPRKTYPASVGITKRANQRHQASGLRLRKKRLKLCSHTAALRRLAPFDRTHDPSPARCQTLQVLP